MTDQRARLERLLDSYEEEFRAAFLEYVRTVRSDAVMDEILDQLEAGNATGALSTIQRHVQSFGNSLPRVFVMAAEAAVAESLPLLPAGVAISFDPTNPRAADMMRRDRLALIRDFSEKQIISVRGALARSFDTGAGRIATAREIRGAIGLTANLDQAVQRYREILSGPPNQIGEALSRDLRDRRFDRTVDAARRAGRKLTPQEVDRMVERYRERALQYRAEMIARTESTRVNSMAREEAFQQQIEQLGIPANRVTRVWNATQDQRTRDAHATMDGQRRGLYNTFRDGEGNALQHPGDPAAPARTVINCRCVLTMEFEPPE